MTSVDPLPASTSAAICAAAAAAADDATILITSNRLLNTQTDSTESNRAVSPPPSILLTRCEPTESASDGELVEQQPQATESSVQPRPNSADLQTTSTESISKRKQQQQQWQQQHPRQSNSVSSSGRVKPNSVSIDQQQLLQPISADDNLRLRSNSEGNKFGSKRGNFTLSSIIRRSLFAGQEAVSCPVTPQHPNETVVVGGAGGESVSGSPQLGRVVLGHAKPMAKSLSNKMRGMISKGKHQLAIARSYSLEGGKFIAKKVSAINSIGSD